MKKQILTAVLATLVSVGAFAQVEGGVGGPGGGNVYNGKLLDYEEPSITHLAPKEELTEYLKTVTQYLEPYAKRITGTAQFLTVFRHKRIYFVDEEILNPTCLNLVPGIDATKQRIAACQNETSITFNKKILVSLSKVSQAGLFLHESLVNKFQVYKITDVYGRAKVESQVREIVRKIMSYEYLEMDDNALQTQFREIVDQRSLIEPQQSRQSVLNYIRQHPLAKNGQFKSIDEIFETQQELLKIVREIFYSSPLQPKSTTGMYLYNIASAIFLRTTDEKSLLYQNVMRETAAANCAGFANQAECEYSIKSHWANYVKKEISQYSPQQIEQALTNVKKYQAEYWESIVLNIEKNESSIGQHGYGNGPWDW